MAKQEVRPPRKVVLPHVDQWDADEDILDHGAVLVSLENPGRH